MNYPRRSFLRDTAVLSVAAALGVRPSFAACQARAVGVRVFFAGSWLFCHDPASNPSSPTMLAVTLDPSQDHSDSMDLQHTFPYGLWKEPASKAADGFWNNHNPSLPACPLASPYVLSLGHATGGVASVNDLFQQTSSASRFLYIKPEEKQGPYRIQPQEGLRVVRLPIPAGIVPADYRTDATISGTTKTLQSSGDPAQGIATTHIFQYPNAKSLTFNGVKNNVLPSAGYLDYHFHTVAQTPTQAQAQAGKPMSPHAPRMFARLFGLLTPPLQSDTQFALNAGATENIVTGPCTLDHVSNREQELPNPPPPSQRLKAPSLLRLNLATCDSGGFGVACPPEGC